MSELTEGKHAGEFLVSEANGDRSREAITVLSGQNLKVGAVLGVVKTAVEDHTGNTGNGAMSGLAVKPDVELGDYEVKMKSTGPGVAAAGTSAAVAGNTGDGTITASPATGANAKVGVYRVTCIEPATDLGKFMVQDPDGVELGIATVGSAFSTGSHLTFTIADGATDFAAGDSFTITVAAANSGTFTVKTPSGLYLPDGQVGVAYTSDHLGFTIADGGTDFIVGDKFTITVTAGKYKEYNPSNTDGSEVAAGVLYEAVDASAADKAGVAIVRDAEVDKDSLTWFSGASAGQKTAGLAQLAKLGIIGRAEAA